MFFTSQNIIILSFLAFYSHIAVGSDDAFREQGRVDEVTMNLKMTRPCPTQFSIFMGYKHPSQCP